jgi:6-phosphogluconolactonase
VSGPELRVLRDADAVAGAAAEIFIDRIRQGGHIALSGGSTPKAVYRIASKQVDEWGGAVMWLGDERVVPPEDPRSNYRMAREALGEEAHIQRVLTEQGMTAAAGDYEARLRAALGNLPSLDLALMGLGPDAHTASLFPGKPAVEETRHLVVGVPEAGMEPQVPRVTMTLPVFNAAHDVVFLVSGADKAEAVERAFGPEPDPTSPAARVRPERGRLLVLLDEPAARRLG